MMMQRRQALRIPKYQVTNTLEETIVLEEEENQGRNREGWGLWNNPLVNGVKWIWGGIVWVFKLFFSGDVHEDTRGEEFQIDFQQRVVSLGLDSKLNIDFYTKTFHELCFEARGEKRPILIITMQDNSE